MEEDYILNLALDGPSHSPPYHQETELDAKKNLQSISKTPPQTPKPRNYQSEADFQAIKSTYRPKIEDGDLYKQLPTTLPSSPSRQQLKRDVETIQAAVLEFYFSRRYGEAVEVLDRALSQGEGVLTGNEGAKLREWKRRCEIKLEEQEVKVGG